MNIVSKSFALFIVLLLVISFTSLLTAKPAAGNPGDSSPNFSMPVEYINYTITSVNGTLWAKIDGYYPIYLQKDVACSFDGDLPMVYPMPPQTTNISVRLDNKEVSWVNYTQTYPDALHHTAIGEWWMINSNFENVSDYFELRIHYEHPLEMINGSYIFLYDLNISPYLSPESNNSTAYFTIRMQTNFTSLNAYSTETDAKWNKVDYTLTREDSMEIISIQMHSEYGKPLQGDLVVEFSQDRQISEFPLWALSSIPIGVILATFLYKRKNSGKP